jgi:hypothetical protein
MAVFFGVVHPERGGWMFEQPIVRHFRDETWELIITGSQFRVAVSPIPEIDTGTLKNEVLRFVRGALDALAFHLGTTLTPEFTGGFDGRSGSHCGQTLRYWRMVSRMKTARMPTVHARDCQRVW